MTDDQIYKLREVLNLIAQISVSDESDRLNRENAFVFVKQVVDSAKDNPFAEHWRPDEQS
jgi:hypothetical protein